MDFNSSYKLTFVFISKHAKQLHYDKDARFLKFVRAISMTTLLCALTCFNVKRVPANTLRYHPNPAVQLLGSELILFCFLAGSDHYLSV